MLGVGRVLLILVLLGLIVAGVTGGPFRFALGVDHCTVSDSAASEGRIPEVLWGMYAVDVRVQVSDFIVDEAAGIMVRSDAVTVALDRCPQL